MPGLSVEVKATAEMRIQSWLKSADSRPGVPYAVWMAPGCGRARVGAWPVMMARGPFWALSLAAGITPGDWKVTWGTADTVNVAEWVRGAAAGCLRILEYRGRGAGYDMYDRWPMILTAEDHVWMLGRAGYGGPAVARERVGA